MVCNEVQWSATSCNNRAKRIVLSTKKALVVGGEKQQPQPLEGELMSVEDLCKLLGKSKSAVYRTVRYRDIPYIRQGNRLYFDRATIKKWLDKKHHLDAITRMEQIEKMMTPDPWRYRNRR